MIWFTGIYGSRRFDGVVYGKGKEGFCEELTFFISSGSVSVRVRGKLCFSTRVCIWMLDGANRNSTFLPETLYIYSK